MLDIKECAFSPEQLILNCRGITSELTPGQGYNRPITKHCQYVVSFTNFHRNSTINKLQQFHSTHNTFVKRKSNKNPIVTFLFWIWRKLYILVLIVRKRKNYLFFFEFIIFPHFQVTVYFVFTNHHYFEKTNFHWRQLKFVFKLKSNLLTLFSIWTKYY